MMFPGTILMGAQSRLLPPSVPFRFFVAAALFHVLAWAALAWAAPMVPGFIGGPGPALTAVHTLTLGVFVMTAMGASFQLLTVATGNALKAVWPARLAWWLYFPGVLALLHGFASYSHIAQAAGALLVIAALAVYGAVVAEVLRRTSGLKVAMSHAWIALAALLGLALMGFSLIVDYEHAFLADHMGVALAHMVVAVFGFMGMLALGFSHVLVPMFALSPNPPAAPGWASLALTALGLALGVTGALTWTSWLIAAGALVGLLGAALHVGVMVWAMRKGMRKRLGLSFVLVRAGWALLGLTLVAAAAQAFGLLGDTGAALVGFLALFGWLLTFLLGILQRIIPFLASMNMSKKGHRAPRLSELGPERLLLVHAACHFAALAGGAGAIVLDHALALRIAAGIGAIGAVAYLGYGLAVVRSFINYHRAAARADAAAAAPTPSTSA